MAYIVIPAKEAVKKSAVTHGPANLLIAAATIGAASSFDKLRMRLILLGDATKAVSSC